MLLIHQFDDRYDFAFGETRIRLPLHFLRCTTRSFDSARERARTCTDSIERRGTLGVIAFALPPARRRRDLQLYARMALRAIQIRRPPHA
jgi:hypothetical protein